MAGPEERAELQTRGAVGSARAPDATSGIGGAETTDDASRPATALPDGHAVADKLIAIIARQAMREPSEVMMEHTLDDLAIDSLGLVECVFTIEETFDVSVPYNANEPASGEFDISSVAAIVAAIERLVDQKDGPAGAVASAPVAMAGEAEDGRRASTR